MKNINFIFRTGLGDGFMYLERSMDLLVSGFKEKDEPTIPPPPTK